MADPQEVPAIDFNTFVLSLSTAALMHLDEPNLEMARQSIDILALLEQKTRGNLDGEEERLLAQVLTDLRMRYVAKAEAAASNEDPTNPG
jgi:hypothetical protein